MASDSSKGIPDIVIGRLPIYLRALRHMAQERKIVTSSHELGQRLGISPAQIRKDLSHFGGFGKQGTGYKIGYLQDQLRQLLNVDQEWNVVLVGAGDLGTAIAHYRGFQEHGFQICCIFENDPEKIGTTIGEFEVHSVDVMSERIPQRGVKVAMIAVPAEYAQKVADQLVEAGIRAILNYAPISLNVPENVRVQYLDPVAYLQRMTFYLEEQA